MAHLPRKFTSLGTGRIYYINIPYGALFCLALKITAFLLPLYLVCAHPVVTAVAVPAYVFILYLYYLYWEIVKNFGFRLPPFILFLVLLNIPVFLLAQYLRIPLLHIIGIQ